MRRLRVLVALMVLGALALVGCGGKPSASPEASSTASKSPATAPAAEPAKPKEVMKAHIAVGGKSSILYLPPAIAEYNGFFKDQALDVTVDDLQGGTQTLQALVGGQVDFASMAVEHVVKSKAQGVELVMLVLYTRYPTTVLVVDSKLKDKVKSISDLKGMKVGVTSPGSASHKVLTSLMNKAGMKPTDVEVVGVGTDGMPAALESGKVQAAVGVDPYVTQVVSSGKAFILADLRTKKDTEATYGGEYPLVGLVTRKDVIQKNPELVKRVAQAVVAGNKFIASNSPETISAKLPAEMKGKDEALYLASLRANLEAFSPDGMASDKGLQTVIDSLKNDKVIPDTLDVKPAQVFDSSFAK